MLLLLPNLPLLLRLLLPVRLLPLKSLLPQNLALVVRLLLRQWLHLVKPLPRPNLPCPSFILTKPPQLLILALLLFLLVNFSHLLNLAPSTLQLKLLPLLLKPLSSLVKPPLLLNLPLPFLLVKQSRLQNLPFLVNLVKQPLLLKLAPPFLLVKQPRLPKLAPPFLLVKQPRLQNLAFLLNQAPPSLLQLNHFILLRPPFPLVKPLLLLSRALLSPLLVKLQLLLNLPHPLNQLLQEFLLVKALTRLRTPPLLFHLPQVLLRSIVLSLRNFQHQRQLVLL